MKPIAEMDSIASDDLSFTAIVHEGEPPYPSDSAGGGLKIGLIGVLETTPEAALNGMIHAASAPYQRRDIDDGPIPTLKADGKDGAPGGPHFEYAGVAPILYATGLLDGFDSAKGGSPGKPPKDDPPPDPGTDPGTDPTPLEITARYISGSEDILGGTDFFNVQIDFYGDGWTDDLFSAFVGSADFLSSIIATGFSEGTVDYDRDLATGLVTETSDPKVIVDDLIIEAYISDIDGTGGILGRAGSYEWRDTDTIFGTTVEGMPEVGLMEFDIADANSLIGDDLWDDTVFHEMMHVLGFGSLWEYAADFVDVGNDGEPDGTSLLGDIVLVDDGGTKRPTDDIIAQEYLGSFANAFNDTGLAFLPVETGGGSGTAGSHWDEAVLDNEIMTGIIDDQNYLADFSIAALADLGYDLVAQSTWQNAVDAANTAGGLDLMGDASKVDDLLLA